MISPTSAGIPVFASPVTLSRAAQDGSVQLKCRCCGNGRPYADFRRTDPLASPASGHAYCAPCRAEIKDRGQKRGKNTVIHKQRITNHRPAPDVYLRRMNGMRLLEGDELVIRTAVVAAVSKECGVTLDWMRASHREPVAVEARRVFYLVIREMLPRMSYCDIGRFMWREHSSVMAAVGMVLSEDTRYILKEVWTELRAALPTALSAKMATLPASLRPVSLPASPAPVGAAKGRRAPGSRHQSTARARTG